MSKRFTSVKFNESNLKLHRAFQFYFADLEEQIMLNIPAGQSQALAITKLQEAFMWVGRAMADAQLTKDEVESKRG